MKSKILIPFLAISIALNAYNQNEISINTKEPNNKNTKKLCLPENLRMELKDVSIDIQEAIFKIKNDQETTSQEIESLLNKYKKLFDKINLFSKQNNINYLSNIFELQPGDIKKIDNELDKKIIICLYNNVNIQDQNKRLQTIYDNNSFANGLFNIILNLTSPTAIMCAASITISCFLKGIITSGQVSLILDKVISILNRQVAWGISEKVFGLLSYLPLGTYMTSGKLGTFI